MSTTKCVEARCIVYSKMYVHWYIGGAGQTTYGSGSSVVDGEMRFLTMKLHEKSFLQCMHSWETRGLIRRVNAL